jgi:hypothetical protein
MSRSRRPLLILLVGGLILAAVQQQVLLRRPPRLLQISSSTASSGPAALDLRFSRPMQRTSLALFTQISPGLAWRWLGQANPLRLLLLQGQTIKAPLTVLLAGLDRRGLALEPQRWQWDPRPRLLAVVPVAGGEQLQVQQRDGRWQPLMRPFRRLAQVMPLGDGSGVAVLTSDGGSSHQLWLLPLQQRNLARQGGLAEPRAEQLRSLERGPLLYAHLSSNRRGDLLVQSAALALGQAKTDLWLRRGDRQRLSVEASGPMQLLPEGGGVVVPAIDGLSLQNLPGQPPRRQLLPGSRDLSSFCPVSGRALLVRHWPDYRRSLELVEPGQPPRPLWLGHQGVLASACDRGGERVWLITNDWGQGLEPQLLALDRSGRRLMHRSLRGWEPEPGMPMVFDATRQQLLLTLRRRHQPAQPVLIDARDLQLNPVNKAVRQVVWLAAP